MICFSLLLRIFHQLHRVIDANTWRRAAAATSEAGFGRQNLLAERQVSSISAAPGITKRYCSPLAYVDVQVLPRPVPGLDGLDRHLLIGQQGGKMLAGSTSPTGKMAVALPPKVTARAALIPAAARFKYRRAAAVCLPGEICGVCVALSSGGQRERVNFGHSFSSP